MAKFVPSANPIFKDEYYTPEGAKGLTSRQIRSEYSRLRSIANKRLKSLGRSEFKNSKTYIDNVGKFPKIKDIKTERELRYYLSSVYNLITARSGSLTGLREIRKESIQSLHDHGYTFVTINNYSKFAEFMEYSRLRFGSSLYDSSQVATFFEENSKDSYDILINKFNKWLDETTNYEEKIVNFQQKGSSIFKRE